MSSDAKKTESIAAGPVENIASDPSKRNRWKTFALAFSFGLVWWLILSWLVATSANPVTLNRRQILAAEWVVVATLDDVNTGQVSVGETFIGGELPKAIVVSELANAGREKGEQLLLPLSRAASQPAGSADKTAEYSITSNPVQPDHPMFYPASDEALSQLQTILENSDRRLAE